jgi:hypothetical protein
MIAPQVEHDTIQLFRRKRVMRITEIADLLSCSIPTVRGRLNKWRTYTSYNRNGGYYTLPDVPRFDIHGLWKYQGVFFSRAGNLTRTILHLVENSDNGLDAHQLGELLGLVPRSFISYVRCIPGMVREKAQRRFVYFCADQKMYMRQKHGREEEGKRTLEQLPADVEAIQILVDWIKHPGSSCEECARRLQRAGTRVDVEVIRNLLAHHGIEKKTPDSQSHER